jgi:hypothetical protein
MVGSRGLGKLRGSRRVGACSSAPREAAPTDDYRGSDRGLTRGAPRVSGSRARKPEIVLPQRNCFPKTEAA